MVSCCSCLSLIIIIMDILQKDRGKMIFSDSFLLNFLFINSGSYLFMFLIIITQKWHMIPSSPLLLDSSWSFDLLNIFYYSLPDKVHHQRSCAWLHLPVTLPGSVSQRNGWRVRRHVEWCDRPGFAGTMAGSYASGGLTAGLRAAPASAGHGGQRQYLPPFTLCGFRRRISLHSVDTQKRRRSRIQFLPPLAGPNRDRLADRHFWMR